MATAGSAVLRRAGALALVAALIAGGYFALRADVRMTGGPPLTTPAAPIPDVAGLSVAAGDAASTSRVASTPFDPEARRGADDVEPPSHLRRVVVTVVYDDETPLANMDVEVRAPEGAAPADAEASNSWSDPLRTTSARLDAAGRATLIVPRGAAFVLTGTGDEGTPAFETSAAPPEVDAARLVVRANALVLELKDEAGAPLDGAAFDANSLGSCRSLRALRLTDVAGRIVFRGFDAGTRVVLRHAYLRHAVPVQLLAWDGAGDDPDLANASIVSAAPGLVRATARRQPRLIGRVLDLAGTPIEGAWATARGVVVGREGAVDLGLFRTDAAGRWTIFVERNGQRLALDAILGAITVSVDGGAGETAATVERRGAFGGEAIDFGDVRIPRPRVARFLPVDAEGTPAEGAWMAASRGGGAPWDDSRCEREDGGVLKWRLRSDDALFAIGAIGFLRREVAAEGAGASADAPRKIVLTRGGVLRVLRPAAAADGAGDIDVTLASETPVVEPSPRPPEDGRGYVVGPWRTADGFRFPSLMPGVATTCVFARRGLVYAEVPIPAFVGDETRTITAPKPPALATVEGVVSFSDGSPQDFVVRLRAGGTATAQAASNAAQEARLVDVVEGRYELEIFVGGSVVARRTLDVRAPTTRFTERLPPLRAATLRVRGVPREFVGDLMAEVATPLAAGIELGGVEEDDGAVAFAVRILADATATFVARFAGWRGVVDAPPGRDVVELHAPAPGFVVFDLGPSPVGEIVSVAFGGADGAEETVVGSAFLKPSSARRRLGPFSVLPSRRRFGLRASPPDLGYGALTPAGVATRTPLVEIRSGATTVVPVDF